ncbi:MAG: hypothetical protein IIB41_01685 [Candidatus Marinimicrobia bacterium]|nr:hypothetical protein [Candidatus Neomarinimicrobiota bacterium]
MKNIEKLFKVTKKRVVPCRKGALNSDELENSGVDWLKNIIMGLKFLE